MKYEKSNETIEIGIPEFVSISRRLISPIPPKDEEEPTLEKASRLGCRLANIQNLNERTVEYSFELGEHRAKISGKIATDGDTRVTIIYEISENVKKPSKENLAEARGEAYVSAYILAKELKLSAIGIKIVFVNTEKGVFDQREENPDIEKLEAFFARCKNAVALYAKPEIERVCERLPSLEKLKFPYPNVREGQNEFIHSVFRTVSRGGRLYAQAPTGTGKTVSVLYPALRALGKGKCDKVFYFTPKTTTAIAASECLELFAQSGAKIRAIILYSKERLCCSSLLCREDRELCENSKSNRMQDAVLALYRKEKTVVKREDINKTAKEYGVCPHELSLSYSELCDAVIGDLNYLFDPRVRLRRFFTKGGSYAFLIDEAHNLPDRAREMYSAEISEEELVAPALDATLGVFSETFNNAKPLAKIFFDTLYPFLKEEIRKDENGNTLAATHLSEIPTELYEPFDEAVEIAEKEIRLNFCAKDSEKKLRIKYLREYLEKLKRFSSVMKQFDEGYEMFVFFENGKLRAKLFCIDTGRRISEMLDKGRSAVFFSGTLLPLYYYKSTLGGDRSSESLEVDSPFDREQISVTIMDKLSTRYSEREDTLLAVSRAIAAAVSAKRGNYMVFSPSFAYSEALHKAFSTKYPKIKTLLQKKDMTGKEKEAFLEEFSKEDKSYLIGFTVMGGIYSEGVDLAGDSLIGAIIVGIGLPSLSYEREAISAYYQEKYEEGKQFAYIYPGMNRVLQAGGRVIRRENDKGVVVLIDDRFDDPIYKELMPKLWGSVKFISSPTDLKAELEEFWRK